MNRSYLNSIRSNSCYPTFRKFVLIATFVMYAIAILAVVAGFTAGSESAIIPSIGIAILVALLAKVAQEVSLMLADIADATIEKAGRDGLKSGANLIDRHTAHGRTEDAIKTKVSNSEADERQSSTQVASGSVAQALHTEADCNDLLTSLGYRLTSKGNGWVLREPLGGTVKIADLAALLEYSRPKQFQRK